MWNLRGEVEQGGVPGGVGADAKVDERAAEVLGEQVAPASAAGEEPSVLVGGVGGLSAAGELLAQENAGQAIGLTRPDKLFACSVFE